MVSPEQLLNLGLARELVVIIVAAIPVIELRGAIPLAINLFGFPWFLGLTLAIIGNMLPVPLILLFVEKVTRLLSRIPVIKRLLDHLFQSSRKRGAIVEKYELVGLALLVAVPLPLTGAWTAALLAVLLRMELKKAFLTIFVGVVIAGAIVTSLSLLGWVGAVVAGVGLGVLAVAGLWKSIK